MASKIRVLSDHTINKIAAGEVIENPASVVKELVENSLDAGANDICIEIKGGGRQMIRISDNGSGMNSDDALLCLERHATSKLKEVEDIHSLSTMGFRGEAVPSIASISKFMLLTCPVDTPKDNQQGTMVIVDGGRIISCNPAARAPGTTIEVKSLFFNIPVRKKFLKSPAYDANEILKMVSLIALGYPNVKFQLINDGKTALMASSPTTTIFADQLKARIHDVLGADFIQNMVQVEESKDDIFLRGFVGTPDYTRHNRLGQHLFINQRGVTSPVVAYAVKEGYGTSLASGRHPTFVLHLTLPGHLVDVNVHPQKREVRLRQELLIKDLIIKAVRSTLSPSLTDFSATSINPFANFSLKSSCPIEEPVSTKSEGTDSWVFQPRVFSSPPATPWSMPAASPSQSPMPSSPLNTSFTPSSKECIEQVSFLSTPEPTTPTARVLATIPRYILLDGRLAPQLFTPNSSTNETEGLILIDQKAAHARVIFEKLTKNAKGQIVAQQSLLIPHSLEVTPFEANLLRHNLAALQELGIHIQEFGPNTFLIDAIPQIFGNTDMEMFLRDLIHDLLETQNTHSTEQLLQKEKAKQMALAASRASATHERCLSLEEAQSLLQQLLKCSDPTRCPSGKSTFAKITSEDLRKIFATSPKI